MVFQAIYSKYEDYYEKCQEYYAQIPEDTLPKIAQSALFTFTLTFVFSKNIPTEPYNLGRPLFAAAVASLASLIYALTMPLFHMIFNGEARDDFDGMKSHLKLYRELIKQVVNIALTSTLISFWTSYKVNLFALPLVNGLSFNLILSALDTIPQIAENFYGNEELGDEIREFYKQIGLDTEEGRSSVFFNFGIFPAIGLN